MWVPTLAVWSALAVLAAQVAATEPSELRRLVTLSRHGSRAPNDVIAHLCPNNLANLEAYHVPPGELTEVGMQQMVAVGQHIREVYGKQMQFLSPTLNGVNHSHFQSYFRSDAALRCSQSAALLGFGLYPEGTGPAGFPHQPVAVTMQLLRNEFDFAVPKGPCRHALAKDLADYASKRGQELVNANKPLLDKMGEICGVHVDDASANWGGEDKIMAIKDLADMLSFDRDQRLPTVAGVTPEVSKQLEELAFTNLMERYYSTEREITYWTGGFPTLLRNDLNGAANRGSPSPHQFRYMSYHAHRELLHGLAMMLGWDFTFEGLPHAMGTSSLHPATTMFFELHARQTTTTPPTEEYFVKTFVWSPQTTRQAVRLRYCSSMECPLGEFNAIIEKHIGRTGTWQEICEYREDAATPKLAQVGPPATACARDWVVVVLSSAVCTALALAIAWTVMRHRARRQGYQSIAGP